MLPRMRRVAPEEIQLLLSGKDVLVRRSPRTQTLQEQREILRSGVRKMLERCNQGSPPLAAAFDTERSPVKVERDPGRHVALCAVIEAVLHNGSLLMTQAVAVYITRLCAFPNLLRKKYPETHGSLSAG